MNGVHDLGGVHGFGPVAREENEPTFHASWEAAVVAIMRSTLGRSYNLDEFRHAIERMDPAHYLGSSYYEHWLDGIARILTEKGVVSGGELAARTAFFEQRPGVPATAALRASPSGPAVSLAMIAETSFRAAGATPRFVPGDAVVTRNLHPRGHTRLPRYARGKRGAIAAQRGTHVFPDANAHGLGEQPQPLYTVRFDARELWGDTAEPNHQVHLDLWENYLIPG